MGAETNKTDAVGRVEGMGLVYISGGGRSAISSSFLCRAQEVQGAAWVRRGQRSASLLTGGRAASSQANGHATCLLRSSCSVPCTET